MDATCDDLLSFLAASPTPYHAVESAIARLTAAGFSLLDEASSWEGLAPGRYVVRRGHSALYAFVLPEGKAASGFRIVGAHTDSPNLRLKPRAEHKRSGYVQLGVEVYGGVLLNSWLDRDLGLSGRVVVRDASGMSVKLVKIDRPVARVPQLAIHLDRDVNDRGLVLNRQEHMQPVLGLEGPGDDQLRELCAREVGAKVEDVALFELMLHDVVPPTRGGLAGEMIFSGRLDNLAMCHAAVAALIEAAPRAGEGGLLPIAVLFDHEEVGSNSAHGAAAPILPNVIERLVLGQGGSRDAYHRAIARSVCCSADMAHAVHPNYPERHEFRHRPVLNGGPVVKVNVQQRYATCPLTSALFQQLCETLDVPVQHYVARTDMPCGSTIGPVTATLLGMRTIDVGSPMLSMHSIRELGGARDPGLMTRALAGFFAQPDPFERAR